MSAAVPQREASELPKALLVDDDQSLLKVMKRMLCFDYQITIAEDGQAALEAIKQQSFDVVLTDLRMPRMDGAQLVRQAANHPGPIFVMLTGNLEDPQIPSLLDEGLLYTVLQKPCVAKTLRENLHAAVQSKQLGQIQEPAPSVASL